VLPMTNGRRQKNKIAGGVIVVSFRVDQKPNRQGCKLLYGFRMIRESGGLGPLSISTNAFLRDDDAAIRRRISTGKIVYAVNIDALSDFLEMRPEFLPHEW